MQSSDAGPAVHSIWTTPLMQASDTTRPAQRSIAIDEKKNQDAVKFKMRDMHIATAKVSPTTIFVTVLLQNSDVRTVRVELNSGVQAVPPMDTAKQAALEPLTNREENEKNKPEEVEENNATDPTPPTSNAEVLKYRVQAEYCGSPISPDESTFSDANIITRDTFEEFSKRINNRKLPDYKVSSPHAFENFIKAWIDILADSAYQYHKLLDRKRNFTLIIAPIEEEYDMHQDQSSRYNEREIEVFFQPRVLEVDWEKNGRVTALDHDSAQRLRCMRNIPKHIPGQNLMQKIGGQMNEKNVRVTSPDNDSAQRICCVRNIPKQTSSKELMGQIGGKKDPTDANLRGSNSAIRKGSEPADSEVLDWHNVTKQVVAWSRSPDGDWVQGSQAVIEKCERMIPSKAVLMETKMQGWEFDNGSNPILGKGNHPRSAYFVSISEFELFKIQVNDSGVDMSLLLEQIQGIRLAELKKRRFSDEDSAKRFARLHLPAFYRRLENKSLNESEYFEIKAEDDPARVAKIQNALATIFVSAQGRDAVLIFCDLFAGLLSTQIVERAVAMARFNGPILNFSIQKSLVTPVHGAKKYTVRKGGELVAVKQRLLSRLVTHSFAIDAEEPNDQIHAAIALATEIAGVDRDDRIKAQIADKKRTAKGISGGGDVARAVKKVGPDSKDKLAADRISDAVCILVSGSLENLKQVAEAVGHKMRLFLLEGSGKMCDSLPDMHRSRNNLKFNAFEHCDKLIADCGLIPESVDRLQVCALLTRVLETDCRSMVIHKLDRGLQALQRSWSYVTMLADDQAMISAIERRNEYRRMAKSCSLPSQLINIVCILMSLTITVISTVQGYLPANDALKNLTISNSTQTLGDNSFDNLLNFSGSNTVLQYLIVALPVVLSVLSNLRQDRNWGPKVVAFTYCAEVIESQLFRYKTRTGEYNDSKGGKCALDAASGCSQVLSRNVDKVSESLSSVKLVSSDPVELVPKSLIARISKAPGSVLSACVCAFLKAKPKPSQQTKQASLSDKDPDRADERVSVDTYLKNRLKNRAAQMHHEASRLNLALSFYKATIYVVSASSSILGLLSLEVWVPVTTAAISAISHWNETAQLHEKLKALPAEKQRLQHHQDRLVEQAEKIILSAYKRPPWYSPEGTAMKTAFADPTNRKEKAIISLYFKENMTIDEISKTCQEAETIVIAILFNVRQKVLRIFSAFDLQKVSSPKSLIETFISQEELVGMKTCGLSDEGATFILENAFKVEASQVSHSAALEAAKSPGTVQTPTKFSEIALSKFEDAALGEIPLTDQELQMLREKIVECRKKIQKDLTDLICKQAQEELEEMNVEGITSHVRGKLQEITVKMNLKS